MNFRGKMNNTNDISEPDDLTEQVIYPGDVISMGHADSVGVGAMYQMYQYNGKQPVLYFNDEPTSSLNWNLILDATPDL